ncbi:hypothetical protein VTN00DRAFT_7605 [Thermoascus crustaceus]|uniref:uncharacterized protein n=1 Tax=Thermoascus crustaceus TaxID=5088 RepID=UPI0037440748
MMRPGRSDFARTNAAERDLLSSSQEHTVNCTALMTAGEGGMLFLCMEFSVQSTGPGTSDDLRLAVDAHLCHQRLAVSQSIRISRECSLLRSRKDSMPQLQPFACPCRIVGILGLRNLQPMAPSLHRRDRVPISPVSSEFSSLWNRHVRQGCFCGRGLSTWSSAPVVTRS